MKVFTLTGMVLLYAIIGWSIIKWAFGQKAIDEAKGHLLADLIKWLLRVLFSRNGMIVLGSLFMSTWIGMTI